MVDSNYTIWMVISDELDEAIIGFFQKFTKPNPGFETIKVDGLKEGNYEITNRKQYLNVRTFGSLVNEALPIKLKVNHFLHNLVANRYLFSIEEFKKELTANQLENCELLLPHTFTGTGHTDKVMMLEDFGSRLFIIKEEKVQ